MSTAGGSKGEMGGFGAGGKGEKEGAETYVHILKAFVDLLELPVVRDEIIDVHRAVQVIYASHKITHTL